jgi:hypothetical protein
MHFTYEESPNKAELMQGDVLQRTPALNKLLSEVHPHYFKHAKNQYFMVLTQSCDLVQRRARGCKTRYISIAPVRTLDYVVDRYIRQSSAAIKAELPVIGDKSKSKASEFLQRLFNNNEPEYFFLCENGTDLNADCAAILQLSVAIKADIHFQTCLDAKIVQLNQTFQAKLGWLVGQLYSRVGTIDWEHGKLNEKIKKVLKDSAICVPESNIDFLETEYKERCKTDPDAVMSEGDISKISSSAPTKRQLVIDQAVEVITGTLGQGREDEAAKLRRRLESDAGLTKLLT